MLEEVVDGYTFEDDLGYKNNMSYGTTGIEYLHGHGTAGNPTWFLAWPSTREFDLRDLFASLESLQDGWMDGSGLAPDRDALSLVVEQMARKYPNELPMPAIVPTPEGNLLFEWEAPGDPSIDLELSRTTAVFHRFASDGSDEERKFYLANQRGWSELFRFLQAVIQR